MARFLTTLAASGAIAAAVLALPATRSWAAGPYDGTWIIDFPSSSVSGANTSNPTCAALRLRFEVKDNQVSGRLQRVPTQGNVVENTNDPNAVPVTGTVKPDGAVEAQWGNFKASGKLAGTQAQVTVQGECGPRTGNGVKVM